MLRFLILAAFIPAILATEGLTTCIAGHEPPIQVTVEGCPQAPCNVELGSNAVMDVVFQARDDIVSFRPRTIAFLLGIPIPYELPSDIVNNACQHLADGGECPIPSGTVVTYVFRFPVGENYPPTNNLNIELSLLDQNDNVFTCVRVPINAVAP